MVTYKMKDFNIKVWHYTMSMKDFKPRVRLHEFKVGMAESDLIPRDFESRYLEATMKNIKLSDAFEFEFKYGLPTKASDNIKRQIGNCLRNACLVVVELYPGVSFIMESICPSIKHGICCDYEVPVFSDSLS